MRKRKRERERERGRAKEHHIAKAGRMNRGIIQMDEDRGEGREGGGGDFTT
jgi:hypothetical protein